MESLFLEKTKSTPLISFDAHTHILKMEGKAYPENGILFYEPLFIWLRHYLATLDPDVTCKMEMYLSYINTSSVKAIMTIFDLLNDAYQEGKKISVLWLYDEENDVALEAGVEFKEDLELPFTLRAYPS